MAITEKVVPYEFFVRFYVSGPFAGTPRGAQVAYTTVYENDGEFMFDKPSETVPFSLDSEFPVPLDQTLAAALGYINALEGRVKQLEQELMLATAPSDVASDV